MKVLFIAQAWMMCLALCATTVLTSFRPSEHHGRRLVKTSNIWKNDHKI